MRKHPIMNVYLPDDFPLDAHAAVYKQVGKVRSARELEDGMRDPYRLFIGGWSAVAYRYRAAARHGHDFTNILNRWAEPVNPNETDGGVILVNILPGDGWVDPGGLGQPGRQG